MRDSSRRFAGATETSLDELRIHPAAEIFEQNKRNPGHERTGNAFIKTADATFTIGNDVRGFTVEGANKFQPEGFSALLTPGFSLSTQMLNLG